MTEEKIWDLWHKCEEFWNISLTPEGEDYLKTGVRTPGVKLVTIARKIYESYRNEFVDELDGENAELVKRMLRIVSEIRTSGPIQNYYWEYDLEVCRKIGYSFDEILTAIRYNGRPAYGQFNGKETYRLAEVLRQAFPDESEQYAAVILNGLTSAAAKLTDILRSGVPRDRLGELIHTRKTERSIYLRMAIASVMLNTDKEKYARYIPTLERCTEAIGDEYSVVTLYHCYHLSDALRERLRQLILSGLSVSQTLCDSCMPASEYQDFLKQMELPAYPYYVLVAIDSVSVRDKVKLFETLYQTDRETFLDTYQMLLRTSGYYNALHSMELLALMLKNGGGQDELVQARPYIAAYAGDLNRHFQGKVDLCKDFLLNDAEPLEKLADRLQMDPHQYLRYSGANNLLSAYALLYDKDPIAKKLYDLLFLVVLKQKDGENLVPLYSFFLTGRERWLGISKPDSAELLIQCGLKRVWLFEAYCFNEATSYYRMDGVTKDLTAALVEGHEEEALEFLKNGAKANLVAWIDLLYSACKIQDYTLLLDLLPSKSKLVRKKCEEMILNHEEEVRATLEERMKSYRGEALQSAHRIIKRWDNERKFGKDFTFTDNNMAVEFCEGNYNSGNAKALSWIPKDMLCDVRFRDLTEKAPVIVIEYLLVEYLSLTNPYRIKACDKVMERLCPQDWQAMMENVYQLWLGGGADTKKKNILVPYCIYASDPQIIRFKRQIEQWAEASRGALGAYAVNAIALNGGSVALLMVDGMASKFPNNQVKKAAKAAFAFAAESLGVPVDELADRIVPTLGFSKEGEKIIDYGPRTFTVSLMPDFTLSILDNEKGKAVKSLPKPGAKDDLVKAEAARKEFSELKKQIKAVVQTQTGRLEKVLMNGRCWNAQRWNELFVENAVMHIFATRLVWGVYEEGKLTEAFRYLDDGTFTTVEEEEYTLPEKAQITLVHPVDLDEEQLEAWKEQLEDYEIIQPIQQFMQKPEELTEKDLDGNKIIRYRNHQVTAGKLSGAAKKHTMQRGEVLDGGCYTAFHLVEKYLNLGAEINFEYMYMGESYNETVPLDTLIFYRLPENGVITDEIKEEQILDPKQVPARFLSSVLSIFDGMVASEAQRPA